MSTSLLYHFFGVTQHKYLKIEFKGGSIFIHISKQPHKRRCVDCGSRNVIKKGKKIRKIRTIPVAKKPVFFAVHRQRLQCRECGAIKFESLDIALPKKQWTKALGRFVIDLLEICTVKDVADFLGMNWNTIKEIHSQNLEKRFKRRKLTGIKYLGVDEIAVKKGHKYMTIVANLETGEIVWVCEGRSKSSLEPFIRKLKRKNIQIKAISMDMWRPFINAVTEHFSEDIIVFDKYHIVAGCNKMLDKLRTASAKEAEKADKKVYKGTRYLLLEGSEKLVDDRFKKKLDELLQLNEPLSKAYILKEELRRLWDCANPDEALQRLNQWLLTAYDSGVQPIMKFAQTIARHSYGIINYFKHRITNAKVEGINNKIKTLKRQAYGFRDMEYFKKRIYFLNEARYSLIG